MKHIPIPDQLLESSGALRSLWLALMLRADENGQLAVSVKQLEDELEYSRQHIRTLLKKLTNNQLINQQATNRATNITICDYVGLTRSAKTRQQTNNKPSNKQPTNKTAAAPDYISPPFVAEEFRELWQRYMEYRKEIKKPYKSLATEKIAYDKMVRLAEGNPEAARDIIERAIVGQWQGLYETKTDNGNRNHYSTNRVNPPRTIEQRVAEYQELADAVSRRVEARKNQ